MRTVAVLAAALLLTTAGAAAPPPPAPCTAQVQPNPSFEHGTAGWTAGPRMVVLGTPERPARTGRAYATFAGLDVTRTDLLRSTVTIPAGCGLDVTFHARATSTETSRGDYLNMGLAVSGEVPKTRHSLAFDTPTEWKQYSATATVAATERTATITFLGSETAGGGVTTFDVDDVTATLRPQAAR